MARNIFVKLKIRAVSSYVTPIPLQVQDQTMLSKFLTRTWSRWFQCLHIVDRLSHVLISASRGQDAPFYQCSHRPACLTCFPAPTHLMRMNGSPSARRQSSQKSVNEPFVCARWVGAANHQTHERRWLPRTKTEERCSTASGCSQTH